MGLYEDHLPGHELGPAHELYHCLGVRSRHLPRGARSTRNELCQLRPGWVLLRYPIGNLSFQRHGQHQCGARGHTAQLVYRLFRRSRRIHHLLRRDRAIPAIIPSGASLPSKTSYIAACAALDASGLLEHVHVRYRQHL